MPGGQICLDKEYIIRRMLIKYAYSLKAAVSAIEEPAKSGRHIDRFCGVERAFDAIPNFVQWSIAGKLGSQVWTELSTLSLYIGTQQSAWHRKS